ncbi:MAG: hypothetical protein Q9164_007903, partial [Protoblastenia rupestris]
IIIVSLVEDLMYMYGAQRDGTGWDGMEFHNCPKGRRKAYVDSKVVEAPKAQGRKSEAKREEEVKVAEDMAKSKTERGRKKRITRG